MQTRQFVERVKADNVSGDKLSPADHCALMSSQSIDEIRERAFNDAFLERVKDLRKRRGWTQEQMAQALGIPDKRYSKYETRSPLPPYLIEHFANLTGVSIEFLLTGREARPRRTPVEQIA